MVKLKAEGQFQEIILAYLNTIEDEVFIEKVNSGDKDLDDCENFIYNEMRKKAVHSRAFATDQEVFGLAVHYFEEDGIPKTKQSGGVVKTVKVDSHKSEELKPRPEPKVEKPKKVKPKAAAELEGQMSFDFGGM